MDEDQFPQEDIENLVKNSISSCLSEWSYQPKLVDNKTHLIVDACLKELQTLNRPFKYIVTCIIMQKNGAGLDTGAALFWDNAKDGLVSASSGASSLGKRPFDDDRASPQVYPGKTRR